MKSRRSRHRGAAAPGDEADANPYQLLGVSEDASFEEIRKAYLMRVRLSPPEQDPHRFRQIRAAYGRLKDGAERRALDLSLFRTQSGLPMPPAEAVDALSLYRRRVFALLLASSDLYMADFHRYFEDIQKPVDELK